MGVNVKMQAWCSIIVLSCEFAKSDCFLCKILAFWLELERKRQFSSKGALRGERHGLQAYIARCFKIKMITAEDVGGEMQGTPCSSQGSGKLHRAKLFPYIVHISS